MTEEQINIKIAELCGWKPYPPITNDGWPSLMVPPNSPKKEGWVEDIPNYAADLNACHEFAAWLDLEQQIQFAAELQSIVLENPCRAWWDATAIEVFQIADATARQRCEAFLRVHNQWEETK